MLFSDILTAPPSVELLQIEEAAGNLTQRGVDRCLETGEHR